MSAPGSVPHGYRAGAMGPGPEPTQDDESTAADPEIALSVMPTSALDGRSGDNAQQLQLNVFARGAQPLSNTLPGVLCVTGHSDRPEAETFIAIHKRGFGIQVMCPADAPHFDRLRAAGVPLLPLSIKGKLDRDATRTIREQLQSGRFHILHVFNNQTVTCGLRAARGLPVKIIAYRGIVGNVSYFDPISYTRYLNPRIDRIVCVANAIRDYLLNMRLLWLRLPRERVVTIHKGHDLSWYQAEPTSLAEFGIPEGAFVIGCVTNYRPRKGIEVLIRAFEQMRAAEDVHLLLIGRMDDARLTRAIAASPVAARIHRIGYRKDAADLIASCQLSALPSLRREGLPKTVIEAMVYGVTPVVTNVGGSAELVVDGECGRVVEPGDASALAQALDELRADPERSRAMGLAARERIRDHFKISTTIDATAALYLELTGE